MKRALIIRLGAYGDMIIISPVIQKLKDLGYYIILNTGKRGLEVFKHDTRVDEYIEHDESVSIKDVGEHWEKLKGEVRHDIFINFSESIECNVALHPRSPLYIYPKNSEVKQNQCNRNYYDVTKDWANVDYGAGYEKRPSLMFTEEEEKSITKYLKKDMFNIIWCLSGSGKNKAYPWTDYVIGETLKTYPNTHFITVGDEKCQILEDLNNEFPKENITQLSGKISIRESMLLTKYVDLVISPDTAVLHASGCYDTPKIGLLGHTTINNITKYFENDFSIESETECAPRFRLIYDWELQCPLDPVSHAALCMHNIKPSILFNKIKEVIEWKKTNKSTQPHVQYAEC